jgi:hypothetical protein
MDQKTWHFDTVWFMSVRVQMLHMRDSTQVDDSLEVICMHSLVVVVGGTLGLDLVIRALHTGRWASQYHCKLVLCHHIRIKVQVWHSTCYGRASILLVLKAQNHY